MMKGIIDYIIKENLKIDKNNIEFKAKLQK